MALAIRGAATLKPEIRLAQALSEYEAILNDDEKASFRRLRAGKPPIPSDVMKLTADIDRDNSQRWGRRCVGPRLTSILTSVQQFTTIVDFVIGGSQCLIAGAIWGTLKTTLQLAVGFASFFDDLSALYMQIGRNAPRLQDYGALYAGAPRLQRALCEYFCIVVNICHKAVLFIRRRFVAQLSTAVFKPFKTEFSPLVTQLTNLAEAIREEASLASEQEFQLERQDASAFRTLLSSRSTQAIQAARKRASYKTQLRFLDACSTFDYQAPWKRARKAGLSTQILAENTYKQWIEDSASSALWCTGKLGCGKTVSTATLVEETIVRFPEASVAHFFCNHDNLESLKVKTIIGTLVRQLLTYVDPEKFDSIHHHDLSTMDEETMVGHFGRLTSAADRRLFVFVDGLDECDEVDLKTLLRCLEKMMQLHHLHVFCLSRPDVADKFQALLSPKYKISFLEENPEIARYIDIALEDCLQSGSLCLGNPELIMTIREKLLQGCQGMFLWVVFQIEALCMESTDNAILHALDSLPKSLPETYERILRRLDKTKSIDSDLRRKIFALVTAATRPLNADELREAASVIPGDTVWDPDKQINDMQKVLTNCGSLLLTDEEDMTVRFAHHSVRQYVISVAGGAGTAQHLTSSQAADLMMGEICITYLNLGVFETQLTNFTRQKSLASQDVTMSVVGNTLSSGSARKMALQLLKNRRTTTMDLSPGLRAEIAKTRDNIREKHAFLAYAKDFWLFHTTKLDGKVPAIYRLWLRLLDGQVSIIKPPWDPDNWRLFPRPFLEWTINHEHEALLAEIEQSTRSTFWRITDLLILYEIFARNGKEFNARGTPYCYLVKLSKLSATWKLLAAVIETEAKDVLTTMRSLSRSEIFRSNSIIWPIHAKAWEGSYEVLFARIHDVARLSMTIIQKGLMMTAAAEGWLEVTTMLFGYPATYDDPEESPYSTNEALLCAAEHGQADIVAFLLKREDVNVNAKDHEGQTALALAVQNDSTAVMQTLLAQNDIDINTKDEDGWTPLHHAAHRGAAETVTLLLDRKDIRPLLEDCDGHRASYLARTNRDLDQQLRSRLDDLCGTNDWYRYGTNFKLIHRDEWHFAKDPWKPEEYRKARLKYVSSESSEEFIPAASVSPVSTIRRPTAEEDEWYYGSHDTRESNAD